MGGIRARFLGKTDFIACVRQHLLQKRDVQRVIVTAVLSEADMNVRIGYHGDFRGSLSSAASAAVLAFEVGRQNTQK